MSFIKDYWPQIIYGLGIAVAIIAQFKASREATKCSLRNDILQIYTECRPEKQITLYQLEAIALSYELYKKLKGNSFVDEIYKEVQTFKKIQ